MPILTPNVLEMTSHSADQTVRLGMRLGELVPPDSVVALLGGLGAGKTAFASGFGAGWGAIEPVSSPTFVFAHAHHRAADATPLYHIDAYRLRDAADAESIGLSDMLDDQGVLLIEWADRVTGWLPAERLTIRFNAIEESPTRRLILFEAVGDRYLNLLDSLRRHALGR